MNETRSKGKMAENSTKKEPVRKGGRLLQADEAAKKSVAKKPNQAGKGSGANVLKKEVNVDGPPKKQNSTNSNTREKTKDSDVAGPQGFISTYFCFCFIIFCIF